MTTVRILLDVELELESGPDSSPAAIGDRLAELVLADVAKVDVGVMLGGAYVNSTLATRDAVVLAAEGRL